MAVFWSVLLTLGLCFAAAEAQDFTCFSSNNCRGRTVEDEGLSSVSDCCAGLGLSYSSEEGCSNCFSEDEFIGEGGEYSLAVFDNIFPGPFFQFGRIRISVCPVNVDRAEFIVRTTPSDSPRRTRTLLAPTVFTVDGSQRLTDSGERDKRIRVMASESGVQLSLIALSEEYTSSDAFKVLPIVNLPNDGYEYYAVSVSLSFTDDDDEELEPQLPDDNSVMLIVTTEPNTVLTIIATTEIDLSAAVENDLKDILDIETLPPNTPLTIEFESAGQTLYLGSLRDNTGSRVVSNKPIAFFSGHECGSVPSAIQFCDHMVEQIPPTATWGKTFITVPFASRESFDLFKIIASRDNTLVRSACNNDSRGADILLNAGGVEVLRITSNVSCYFESTNPILLMQFSVGNRAGNSPTGDPFMVIVPPVEQFRSSYIITAFAPPTDFNFLPTGTHYVNILLPGDSSREGVMFDGEQLPLDSFVPIPCVDSQATCAYGVQMGGIANGDHTISHNDSAPLNVVVYWLAARVAQGYPGGMTQRPIALPAVNFTLEEFSAFENETTVDLLLTRSGDLNTVASVTVRTIEITDGEAERAQVDDDFEVLDTTVMFAEGVTEMVVSVPLVDDVFPEEDEVLEVYLSVSPGVYIFSPSSATVIILNDDPPLPVMNVSFAETGMLVREGEGLISIRLNKTEGAVGPVSVRIFTADDSASSTDDYTAISEEVTFEIEDLEVEQFIVILDNMQVEENERFRIFIEALVGPFPVNVEQSEAVVTIVDNDVLVIGFDPVNYVVNEGVGSVELNVAILSGRLETNLDLEITFFNDTALENSDFEPPSTLDLFLTFGPSAPLQQTFAVNILDDLEVEETELFTTMIANTGFAGNGIETRDIVLATREAQIRIEDDDEASISLSAESASAVEGGVGARVAVSVQGTLGAPVEVTLTTFNGNATADVDYVGVNNMIVTLTSETPSQEVIIEAIDDEEYEGPEAFIAQICLLSGDNNGISIGVSTVQLLIQDNELPPVPRIGFMDTVYTVVESSRAVVVLLQSDGVNPQPVQVSFITTAGSASSADFSDFASGTATFLPGSTLQRVTVPIEDDGIAEMIESFTLQLQSGIDVEISVATTEIRIEDDDSAVIAFSQTQYTVAENVPQMLINVARLTEISSPVSVLLCTLQATASEGSDFVEEDDEEIIFQPDGPPVQQVALSILDDVISEGDEVFLVQLKPTGTGTVQVLIEEPLASVTIEDNDSAEALRISFTEGVYVFDEDEPTAFIEVELSTSSAEPITVFLSTAGGSANETSDYEPLAQQSVTFAPLDRVQVVVLQIVDDDILEEDEDFSLLLLDSDGVTLDSSTVIIQNDDDVFVRFTGILFTVQEADAIEIEVELRGTAEIPVIVNIDTGDLDAVAPGDYTAVSLPVAFTPGENVITFSIPILLDLLDEGLESFGIGISSTQQSVIPSQILALVLVEDFAFPNVCNTERNPCDINAVCSDTCGNFTCTCLPGFTGDGFTCDSLEVELRFTRTVYAVSEGEDAVLEIELDGLNFEPILVEIFLFAENATATLDFDDTPQEILFEPGRGLRRRSVVVSTNMDDQVEEAEVFMALLVANGIRFQESVNLAAVVILDDQPVLRFNPTEYAVREGEVVTLRIELDGSTVAPVEVMVISRNGTAIASLDFLNVFERIEFPPGNGTRVASIAVPTFADSLIEGNETFSATIFTDDVSLQDSVATVVIVDDAPDATLRFNPVEYTVVEGEVALIRIEVEGQNTEPIETEIMLFNNTANANIDFMNVTQTLVIQPGSGSRVIILQVPTFSDILFEDDEQFFVTRSSGIDEPTEFATVTILDSSPGPVIGLETSLYIVSEGTDQSAEVCVVLEEGVLARNLLVRVSTADNTAQGGYFSLFFPFNVGIDAIFDDIDDDSTMVGNLTTPYILYGNSYTAVYVGSNGQISFGEGTSSLQLVFPTTPPLVTAFWDDINPGNNGTIYHRVVNSGSELDELNRQLRDSECLPLFEAASAAVITFDGVAEFGTDPTIVNTFQVILLTDGTTSYSVFLYSEMNWGNALIGFNDGTHFYSLSGGANVSVLTDATTLLSSSNVGIDGVYIFRTDSTTIEEGVQCPDDEAEGDYGIVDQGLTLTPVMSRVCAQIPIFNDTFLEQNETFVVNITTEVARVNISRPFTTVSIIDDDFVTFEFEEPNYTVSEGDGRVTVCVTETSGTALPMRSEINVRSEEKPDSSQPATAGVDFQAVESFGVGIGPRFCYSFGIANDSDDEGNEQFQVVFSNLPTRQVLIGTIAEACVTIVDDDVDECARGLDNCHNNATCIDTAESFSCVCNSGFTGNGVNCTALGPCNDGDIRLVGGADEFEGRVEVCLSGVYGTVCDDTWTIEEGDVVCAQLFGPGYIGEVCGSACFGEGAPEVPIYLDNVGCSGLEPSLLACPFDPDTSDCSHAEDAGVMCILFG